MTATAIGPLASGDDVCRQVEEVLTTWLPSTLRAHAEATGLPRLPVITEWAQVPEEEALRAAHLPAGSITTPGVGDVERDEHGRYVATWTVVVTTYARDDSYSDTARAVRTYALAVRACLMQHPHPAWLDVEWVAEDYARLDDSAARTLGGGAVAVLIQVPDVLDVTAGFDTPPLEGSPLPTRLPVSLVDVDTRLTAPLAPHPALQ